MPIIVVSLFFFFFFIQSVRSASFKDGECDSRVETGVRRSYDFFPSERVRGHFHFLYF